LYLWNFQASAARVVSSARMGAERGVAGSITGADAHDGAAAGRAVGAALRRAGKEGVFAAEGNRSDGALDGVGADFDAAVIE